jgi:hypothetical protein
MSRLLRSTVVQSLLIRAARTYIQTFLAFLIVTPALEIGVLKGASLAGLTAVLSMLHRLLDETPVPSLVDRNPGPTAPPAIAPSPTPAEASP